MPLRKYQIARKAIDKTKLDDDAQVRVETQLLFVKGAGELITGNAGTAYGYLAGSDLYFVPDNFKNILKVEFLVKWDPMTTAGGVRLFNLTDVTVVKDIEPGAAGWRYDEIDVTTTFKGYTAEKLFEIATKGDGATAPVFRLIILRVVVDTSS